MNFKRSILAICLTLVICIPFVSMVACSPSGVEDSASVKSGEETSSDGTDYTEQALFTVEYVEEDEIDTKDSLYFDTTKVYTPYHSVYSGYEPCDLRYIKLSINKTVTDFKFLYLVGNDYFDSHRYYDSLNDFSGEVKESYYLKVWSAFELETFNSDEDIFLKCEICVISRMKNVGVSFKDKKGNLQYMNLVDAEGASNDALVLESIINSRVKAVKSCKLDVCVEYASDVVNDPQQDSTIVEDSGYEIVKISVNKTVNEFKFIGINLDEYANLSVGKVLHEQDKLIPDKPFVVKTFINEGMSLRGISYLDENGERCYFRIMYNQGVSGVSDTLYLEPLKVNSNTETTPELSVEWGSACQDDDIDFKDNWYTPIVGSGVLKISASKTVKNFRFVNILYSEEGNPYVVEKLYGAEILSPNDDFFVKTYIRKAFSNRGVSYLNGNGESCYAVIEYNAEGYISLTPFKNAKLGPAKTITSYKSSNETVQREVEFDGTVTGLLNSFSSLMPCQGKINNFYIANGVAHIDFNQVFYDNVSRIEYWIENVVAVLLSYYGEKGADRVLITIDTGLIVKHDGQVLLKEFGSEDDGKHYAALTLFDVYAIDTYIYPVSFDGTIEGLIAALVTEMSWNEDVAVKSFEIENRIAYIDLNDAFGKTVYAGLMSESGVTCVCQTIMSYYGDAIDNVSLTIDGAPFVSDYM